VFSESPLIEQVVLPIDVGKKSLDQYVDAVLRRQMAHCFFILAVCITSERGLICGTGAKQTSSLTIMQFSSTQ
jgi:hypothetical protein